MLDGVRKATLDLKQVESFVHGSTVAINTAIERTGARTALIVTRGTRDVYQIARGNRPESYNILFQRAEPLAPPRLTFEVDQRTTAWGEALIPFDEAQARKSPNRCSPSDVEAVAICFLAFLSGPDRRDARMADILREARRHRSSSRRRTRFRAQVGRVRAHLDHRAERLYRSAHQQIRQQSGDAARSRMASAGGC